MNYLIDTHVLLWMFQNPSKIPAKSFAIIDSDNSQLFISVAVLWEFSIKYSLGKLRFIGGLDALLTVVQQAGITVLPIKHAYLNQLIELERKHGDPFDRLMIATSTTEKLTFITADQTIQTYPVDWLWS